MKTILVTGGAGFIGSHLCDYLLKQDNKVICVDNLFTGSKKNIEHLANNGNFHFIKHDIVNPLENLQTSLSLLKISKIDQLFNLACPASPIHYQKDPIETIKANTVGVVNMLELATKMKARFLQASTSEVYGDPLEHPQKETYWGNVNPIGPRACYDEGKRVAETLCFDYKRGHNADIRVVRIFNTYGPRMARDDGRVVSNFIVQALENNDITLYGDGSQTRSFCYVSDLVNGLVTMMNTDGITGPINLGNPQEFSIKNIADIIIKMTGSKSKIIHHPLPENDPTRRKPAISLAKKILSWQPHVLLEDGLTTTIEYFKKLINT